MFSPTQSIGRTANQGISPSGVYGTRSSRACHLQWWGASGELSLSLYGGAGLPCSNYTISPLPTFYISPAMLLSASCSWAARLTSSCEKGYFALSLAHRGNHFIKWAEQKYATSPIAETCPVPRRSRPKTVLQNGFIWRTFPFRTLFGGVFLSSAMLL